MHGVLFFVLKELIAMKDELCQRFDLTTHLDHCEKVFAATLETYDVLAVPSFENILALTMGVSIPLLSTPTWTGSAQNGLAA